MTKTFTIAALVAASTLFASAQSVSAGPISPDPSVSAGRALCRQDFRR